MLQRKSFSLPFSKKEFIATNTYSFYFSRTEPFDFLPGQYITLHLSEENNDYDTLTHDFTIASSPLEQDCIMITTKIVHSTEFKKRLLALEPGDLVRFSAPEGGFYFNEEVKHYVFLAGGIGITPFHSIIDYVSKKNLQNDITLLASFSTTEDILFYDELTKISNKHSNVKVIYSVSHPEESEKPWIGEKGRITPQLIKKYVKNISVPKFLIVGPVAMVSEVEEMINNMGVKDRQIQIENFTGY